MSEIMVATSRGHVLRYRWDGTQHRDYNLDLRRIPFCINQQVSKGSGLSFFNLYYIMNELFYFSCANCRRKYLYSRY